MQASNPKSDFTAAHAAKPNVCAASDGMPDPSSVAGFGGHGYKFGDIPPDPLGNRFDPCCLADRFHPRTSSPQRWVDAKVVAAWIERFHLAYSEFEIPLLRPINYDRLPMRGTESRFHCHAKVSVAQWLRSQFGVKAECESDGFDVYCEALDIVAEVGDTTFNRFEWLMSGRYSRLLMVERATWGGATVGVMSFTPTIVGSISRRLFEASQHEERRRLMEASFRRSLSAGYLLAGGAR